MHKLDLSKLELVRDSERWGYTSGETRARLGISVGSLRRLIKEGHLKVYYIGKSKRITVASVAKLKRRLSIPVR